MPTFRPITLTIPHPASLLSMFKPLNFNAQWNYNQNAQNMPATSYGPPPTTQAPYVHHQQQQAHSFNKQFNWDLNWNFNHGSSSSLGAATNQKEEAPVLTTTQKITTTTTAHSIDNSQNSNGLHGEKQINVKWSLDFNHNNNNKGGSSGNAAPSTNLQPPNKASVDFGEDEAADDDDKNDANDESDR
jgi:hypothetical protein